MWTDIRPLAQRRSERPFHATIPSRPHRQSTSTSTLLSFAFPLVSHCCNFPSIEAFSCFLICPFSSEAPSQSRLLIPLPPQNSNNLQLTAVAVSFLCPIKYSRVKVRRARGARALPRKYLVYKFLMFCIFQITYIWWNSHDKCFLFWIFLRKSFCIFSRDFILKIFNIKR